MRKVRLLFLRKNTVACRPRANSLPPRLLASSGPGELFNVLRWQGVLGSLGLALEAIVTADAGRSRHGKGIFRYVISQLINLFLFYVELLLTPQSGFSRLEPQLSSPLKFSTTLES